MSKRRRQYRKREANSDDEEETTVADVLEERKEMQRFRQKSKGLTASALAFGLKLESEVEVINDPFKLKTGGLVELNSIKDRDRDRSGEDRDVDVTNLGSNFSIETNRRDEDVEMLKYIEEEMSRRQGKVKVDQANLEQNRGTNSGKEDLLFAVPERIDVKSKATKSEEMLSNQMLSGIPEVDLGIQAKIKNIEQTEEAKVKYIAESRKKKQMASDFVPTNMASNFVHHDRFYDEKKAIDKERMKARKVNSSKEVVKPKGPVVGPDLVEDTTSATYARQLMGQDKNRKRDGNDKASDDFLYERFRKKARDSWRYQ